MNSFKRFLRLRIAPSCLPKFFSSKKSNEQLAYYQHRLETLPNFSNSALSQLTSQFVQPSPSKTFYTNTQMQRRHHNLLRQLKLYAEGSHLLENTAKLPSLMCDRNISGFRSPSSPPLIKFPIVEETSSEPREHLSLLKRASFHCC